MTEVEKKNNHTKIFVADLKNQLQEAKRVEKSIEQQLKKSEQELENLFCVVRKNFSAHYEIFLCV